MFDSLKPGFIQKCKKKKNKTFKITRLVSYTALLHDVTAAILVFQNNETAAVLVFQTNPVKRRTLSYLFKN